MEKRVSCKSLVSAERLRQGDDTGFNFRHAELVSASFIRQFPTLDKIFYHGSIIDVIY